jgi:phage head maturation protease
LRQILQKLHNKFTIASVRLAHPNYFYGYFTALKLLDESTEPFYHDILQEAYDNILKDRFTSNVLRVLPLYDRITLQEFTKKLLDEYDRLVLKYTICCCLE